MSTYELTFSTLHHLLSQCVCVYFCFQVGLCFLAILSVSDKSFDSRFVLFLIYCHTQTFFFAFSHYLSLSFFLSVTLNVILYFANLLRLPSFLLSFSLSHCYVCFQRVFFCKFVCIILDSVKSVFDLLCWLFIVKHTFNSSILYCICFPFLLSSVSRVWLCLCACSSVYDGAHKYTRTHAHTHTCTPSYIDWKPQTDAQLVGLSFVIFCKKFTMLNLEGLE